MDSVAEQLTEQFYLWEHRGRGWQVWDAPCEIEPPFEPFRLYSPRVRQIDDGRKHTLLSGLIERVRDGFNSTTREQEAPSEQYEDSFITPEPFFDDSEIFEISIALPPDEKVTADQTEQFLVALSLCRSPISFEILGTREKIIYQFTCRQGDQPTIEGALRGYFPGAVLESHQAKFFDQVDANYSLVVDFGLSEEFMRPLRTSISLDHDILISLVAALETLQEGEVGMLQVLFHSTRFPWTESILRSVSDGRGGCFFADAPDMLQLAREKTKHPLFAAVIRVVGISNERERLWNITRGLASGLLQLSDPLSNELIPLTNEFYDPEVHIVDVVKRISHRSGMLLNSRELAAIVHPPSGSIRSTKLLRYFTNTRPVPSTAQGHSHVLGENLHKGKTAKVSLETRQRLNHMHIIGATGTGKSTLLHNLIVQDIEQGYGLAVIDPHGDLIERVIACVPGRRFKDVVLFDPSDAENPIGINILSAKGEAEKNVAASDLVAAFKRMSTSWGDQMTVVLGNAIQAFLESNRGGTLLDLRKFLLEDDFRKEFLRIVTDEEIRYFWEKQHHILRGNTLGSILTRLDTFLRPKIIRKVVAPKVELHFDEILDCQKILLVKLAQGLMGEENSTLLGTLVVSKLHQGAMARQSQKASDRTPFFLYIDEFQNFITPSLAGVLSGTRKYGVGLILAHQELRQIFNQDTGVANSVISNPGTRICFRLGDFDAQKLQEGFAHFTSQDLQNLGLGEAITRVDKSDYDFNLKIFPPRTVNPETGKSRRKRIIEQSHEGYKRATSKEDQEIETETIETPIVEQVPLQARVERREIKKVTKPIEQETQSEPVQPIITPEPVEDKTQSQHRYLQALIKRMAEDRGFHAIIEEPTPNGLGRIDVGLEQNGKKIACEVSVTTDDQQEFHNIEKCLSAGYDKIIVCAPDRKKLDKIKTYTTKKLSSGDQEKILFFEPEALFVYLEGQVAQQAIKEERVKGYRVKVEYQSMSESERSKKRESVAQVVLQSIQRLKGKQ
ncbi:MAG: type IV secretion system DNA-binding domain-containing protein [Ignavibacteriales bacterium]|nr:type IV secretion system DNA-binding domain-containing protein [Ignavibacteriales bacterium]